MEETDGLDHQQMAIELCDGFTPHDVIALGALKPDELVAQYEARLALHEYVDNVWEHAKLAGLDPANDPKFAAVAGLRDLTAELLGNAENADGD